jgi:Holliday junction resolvase-like predicted endonuclease
MENDPAQVIDRVIDYLKGHGLEILDRDWPAFPVIAADHGKTKLIVVIVLARRRGSAPYITETRKRAARVAGFRWMGEHGMSFDQIRVDLVYYTKDGTGGFTIEHTEGIA